MKINKKQLESLQTIKSSKNSFDRCIAFCYIGESYFYTMTDAMLYIVSSSDKVLKNLFHCFNEIFKYHSWLNHYSEAGLSFFLIDEVNDELIKKWIDKAGHETVFFDLASTGRYEDFKIIIVDYQLEEYQFIGYDDVCEAIKIIRDILLALQENDTIFTEDNDKINEIIDKYLDEIEILW